MKAAKFKVGDRVQSADDSDDVRLMKSLFVGEVVWRKQADHTSDGHIYGVKGGWIGEDPNSGPRQLHANDIQLQIGPKGVSA